MDLDSFASLAVFLLLSLLVAATGILFRPGRWYETLQKPSWTPPNRAFPIIWTVLYVMIAVSGWLVYNRVGLATWPFTAFAVQLVLNAAWSPLFFGIRRPALALVDILLLWCAIVWTIVLFAGVSAVAAWLLVPYLVWVSIAAALNLSVWTRNPGAFATA
ncbi:TspO/MBR family protein [Mangrovicella endophytica]|uniref:TspO/MBR family protein n=1 Tax=Mangrovicella endophytica TaxID=2066697 RepID=UPI000C9DF9CA|nr:TspO/MBR family protein [Mangrovicella endophytica]